MSQQATLPTVTLQPSPIDNSDSISSGLKSSCQATPARHPMPSIADSPTSTRSETTAAATTKCASPGLMMASHHEALVKKLPHPIQFASEQYDLREFLTCHALPQIVSIAAPVQLETAITSDHDPTCSMPTNVQQNSLDSAPHNNNIDLHAPIVLYRSYTPQRCEALAYCRPLHLQLSVQQSNAPPPLRLFIPQIYSGWFSVVDDVSLRSTAKRYTSLDSVLEGLVSNGNDGLGKVEDGRRRHVLVHGTPMPACRLVTVADNFNGESYKFESVVVASGSVLTLIGVYSRQQALLLEQLAESKPSPPHSSATLLLNPEQLLDAVDNGNNTISTEQSTAKLGSEKPLSADNLYKTNNDEPALIQLDHRHHRHRETLPNFLSTAKQQQQVRTTNNDEQDKNESHKRNRKSGSSSSSALTELFRRAKRSLFGGGAKHQRKQQQKLVQKSSNKDKTFLSPRSPYAQNDIIYTSVPQPPPTTAGSQHVGRPAAAPLKNVAPQRVAAVAPHVVDERQQQLLAKFLVNDQHDMHVYVPLATEATLFCVSTCRFDPQCLMPLNLILNSLNKRKHAQQQESEKDAAPVVADDSAELINRIFPLHVKLVSGFVPPQMPKQFSGYMTVLTCHSCNVVMGCTMPTTAKTDADNPQEHDNNGITLFELDIDEAAFRVRRAKLDPLYCLDVQYRRALRHAREEGDLWLRQIKIVREVYYDDDDDVQDENHNDGPGIKTEANAQEEATTTLEVNDGANRANEILSGHHHHRYDLLALSVDDDGSNNHSREEEVRSENDDGDGADSSSELESDVAVVTLHPSLSSKLASHSNAAVQDESNNHDGLLADIPEEDNASSSSSLADDNDDGDFVEPKRSKNLLFSSTTALIDDRADEDVNAGDVDASATTPSFVVEQNTTSCSNLLLNKPTTTRSADTAEPYTQLSFPNSKALQTPRRLKQQSRLNKNSERRRTTEVTRFDVSESSSHLTHENWRRNERRSSSSSAAAAVLINGMVALPSAQSLHRLDRIADSNDGSMTNKNRQGYGSAGDFTVIFRNNNIHPNTVLSSKELSSGKANSKLDHTDHGDRTQRPHSAAFADNIGQNRANSPISSACSNDKSDDDDDRDETDETDWHTPMSSFDRHSSKDHSKKLNELVAERPPTAAFAPNTAIRYPVVQTTTTTTTTVLTVNGRHPFPTTNNLSARQNFAGANLTDRQKLNFSMEALCTSHPNNGPSSSNAFVPSATKTFSQPPKLYRPQSMLELAATPVMAVGDVPANKPNKRMKQYLFGENNVHETYRKAQPRLCLISCEEGSLV